MRPSHPQFEAMESRLVMSAPGPAPSPDPANYDLVLTDVCEDPIGIKILTDREKTKAFFDKNGNLTKSIQTGTLKVQVVDLKTLDNLVLNISGPQVIAPDGTGTTKGPWLYYFPVGNTQGQDPGLLLINGRTQYTSTSFTVLEGRVVDICEALHTTSASPT
jgi:hypothetical protein